MSSNISDIVVKTPTGSEKSLGDYAGNVLLIVNVASYCGYTPQYAGLQRLHETYGPKGLKVLGFPCNDFGAQEPGSNEEIAQFCTRNYGVTFELFDKVHAIGAQQHPLYARLTTAVTPAGDVSWNFEKFLINKQGGIVARYRSSVKPDDPDLVAAIERELAA
ncbi:MAG: glutathione peroxidase [Cyanobacteria bacterium]|nr:glutathione peroxidase [Cyanobacteriota bacterium]MDW8199644.1 glutathione peroxidase [Cyanobacteriota bacterium SKYGB_h_bin112]